MANAPNGWLLNDATKSPRNRYPMERPNPQPGQKSIPRL